MFGVKLTELADDARALDLDGFRARHGAMFLLGTAGGLREPRRFEQTQSAPTSRPSSPGGGDWLVLPVVKRGGSLSLVRITVGRTANNDVHVEDASVSRLHAFFEPGPPWAVKDAGSRLGTKVNGARIEAPTAIKSGDQIAFGDVELTFLDAASIVHFVLRLVRAPV